MHIYIDYYYIILISKLLLIINLIFYIKHPIIPILLIYIIMNIMILYIILEEINSYMGRNRQLYQRRKWIIMVVLCEF